ncbi:Inhibitor of Apoptosis domain containing protein [Drechmeria coniospora]|uniref:Inhibitor of Apoptosis domain containing protein n=1 Tax=Drechmeria coniospora TaxID=98403 RepID=A0A151GQ62_DRECN|nr:Inhibitor of Apoptosis domain containing protein [Drechmeria coniospora]KYK59236.1 Inhibitor of Apoptosis domain containing protein [Drechmeria coniospora]
MAPSNADAGKYFAHDARLASFQKSHKKRGSTAGGRGKALHWPHKQIAPESLARAGFYFDPRPESTDHVVCFLCDKGLDGWESGDDPLLEHLNHVSHCGWAIVAAIEAEIGDHAEQDPNQPYMVEARKATFAGRWPHEGKKGWKCKTKQLAESGWKYTPTAESDDMATCTYCQLALDGWEPSDKPYRAPGCAFFALSARFGVNKKKTGRGKAARGSKASRLSVQSVGTVASETYSLADTTAQLDDSILTTASIMTQGGGKKTKAKKGTAKARGKSKKKEPAETAAVEQAEQLESQTSPPKQAKATRGRKRGSEAMDDSSVMSISQEPVPKRRATRTRSSTMTNASTVIPDDAEMVTTSDLSGQTSSQPLNSKSRVISTVSTASMASLRGPANGFPDDEEIERQLEADLERDWSDDEFAHGSGSDLDRSRSELGDTHKSADYAMFDPAAAEMDDAAVDEELRALQEEMLVHEPEPQPQESEPDQIHVPKKGRKAATGKVSKQTKSKKAKFVSPMPELEPDAQSGEALVECIDDFVKVSLDERQPVDEAPAELDDAGTGSTDTMVENANAEPMQTAAPKRGRGRPRKVSRDSRVSLDSVDVLSEPAPLPAFRKGAGAGTRRSSQSSRPSRVAAKSVEADEVAEAAQPTEMNTSEAAVVGPPKRGRGRPSKASLASRPSNTADEAKPADAPVKRGRGRPPKKPRELPDTSQPRQRQASKSNAGVQGEIEMSDVVAPTHQPSADAGTPSTPAKMSSPVASAKRPALSPSPSPSPQSSDAENQPPSSKPATSAKPKRVALAPVAATPVRSSPSKRNVLAGLQSSTPWTAVNLDSVFGTPREGVDKENVVRRLLHKGKELTSPEKRMTVEEWIYFNAGEAEKELKHECEAMGSTRRPVARRRDPAPSSS